MSGPGLTPISDAQYIPGVCNIGPSEITRRRRSGNVAVVVAIVLLAALLALAAPHWTRLLLVLPVGAAASGYLQARFHFCAGFGATGVYNFGAVGTVRPVVDAAARARDRARSVQIGVASMAIGLVVAVGAALLPIR